MNHTCCTYNEYIIIYGGYSKEKNLSFSSKIYFFNTETSKWLINQNNENEPEPRFNHSAVVYKDSMIIHGGINPINKQILNDTWIYNLIDGNWTPLNFENESIIIPRFGHAAVVVNKYMFIIGGLTSPKQNFENNQKCICLNIENMAICGVNLIGNFLPGHAMISAIFYDLNENIIVFGKMCSSKDRKCTFNF